MTTSGLYTPQQEPNRVAGGRLVVIGALGLLVFALGIWASARELEHTSGHGVVTPFREPAPGAPQPGAARTGMVDQWLFEGDGRYRSPLGAQRSRLESYGWVDRARGVVHLPIDEAMRRVVAGAAAPAPRRR